MLFIPKSTQINTPPTKKKTLTSLSFSFHAKMAVWVAAIHAGLCAIGVKRVVNGELADDSVWWVL